MAIKEDLKCIYEELTHRLNHPYVHQYLSAPVIDGDKLLVYYLLFRENGKYQDIGEYVSSVMFAEVGLDTHEKMTIENLDEKKEVRSRQLIVLAGDFYSSLYYFSLSGQGDIQMVRWIAEAIQEFNIHKCHLFYPSNALDWEQKCAVLQQIESALVAKIAEKLGLSEWAPAISDYFLFKRLTIERNCFLHKNRDSSLLFHIIKNQPINRSLLLKALDEKIKAIRKRFLGYSAKKQMLSASFVKLLQYFTNKMNDFCQCMVEEG